MQTDLTTNINVRIPQTLKDAIQAEARDQLLSTSDVVRRAIQEYFQRQAEAAGIDPAKIADN